MFRTLSIALGLAFAAASANAADTLAYKVSVDGKSPAEVHAAIEGAADKACKDAYPEGVFQFWTLRDVQACKVEAVKAAEAQLDAAYAARAQQSQTGTR